MIKIVFSIFILTLILTITGIISFNLFLIITGIIAPILTFIIYYEDKKTVLLPPEPPAIPNKQMTPDELNELLSRYCVNEGIFEIPKEHLPLHESFINLASKYSKILFHSYGSNEFDRTLMIIPYINNPLFLQIGEWDSIGMILIRRNSNDANVYIADYHEDMNNPTILTASLHDYLVLSWEVLQNE